MDDCDCHLHLYHHHHRYPCYPRLRLPKYLNLILARGLDGTASSISGGGGGYDNVDEEDYDYDDESAGATYNTVFNTGGDVATILRRFYDDVATGLRRRRRSSDEARILRRFCDDFMMAT